MTSNTFLQIALFTYSTKPRGSVLHTLELAEALHQLGHEVCVYALDKDGTGFDYPLSCQVQLIPAKSASTQIDQLIQQRIQEIIEFLSRSSIKHDIYHAQDCLSASALAILAQQHKIPGFIRTVHHIEDYVSPYLQQCQDRSIREADLCFCVSDRWQTELQQQYHIHAPRVLNGVNTERFSPTPNGLEQSLKQRYGLTGAPIYLTVGGIEPRKNSIRLLQAFKRVLENYPTAQLVIAGGATLFDYQSYRAEFLTQVEKLQIEMNRSLVLPGVIADADLPALYRSADAFVFPSLKEGWGLVVLEAIASSLPVITSNQPPLTEFLNSTQALLVDPNSVEAMAQAMEIVLQPGVSDRLRTASQSVLAHYSWQISAKMHVDQYRKCSNSVNTHA